MAKNQHIIDGNWAEEMACTFLVSDGYLVLHKNWRYKKAEIDIIAIKNKKLYFIEVKYRKANFFGEPEAAVSDTKMLKMQEAAEGFMVTFPIYEEVIFDIISIEGPKENAQLTHFKDAFFPDNLS